MHVGGTDTWGNQYGTVVFANSGHSWDNTYINNYVTAQLGIAGGGCPGSTVVYLATRPRTPADRGPLT